jgi:hypothetical protein
MKEILLHPIARIGANANRLFNILLHAGPVRVQLTEVRDAAMSVESALQQATSLSDATLDTLFKPTDQFAVFLCNAGTGLEQQEAKGFYHQRANQIVLAHLARWVAYCNGLAAAIQAGTLDDWVSDNPPPPGQPGLLHP